MARPRQFDHDQVVAAAAELFQLHGFEATSMRDLIARAGLSSSSIYGAFGGKRGLYLAALRWAAVEERALIAAAITGPDGVVGGLEALFGGLIDKLLAGGGAAASLSLRAALEDSSDEPEVLKLLTEHVTDLAGLLATRLREAADAGEVRLRQDPADLAFYLLLSAFNLTFVVKLTQDRRSLAAYVAAALSAVTGD